MPLARCDHCLYVIALTLSAIASYAHGDDREARRLLVVAGEDIEATIEELQPDWSIGIRVDGLAKDLRRTEYLMWGNYADQARSPQVLLTDGTVLVGDLVGIGSESLTFTSRLWGDLEIDRRFVRAYLLLPAADPLARDREWESLRDSDSDNRVLLLNGDAIAGEFLPTTRRESGRLFGLVSIGVKTPNSESNTSIRIEEVRAMVFRTPARTPVEAEEGLIGFRDGSLVVASKITRPESDLIQVHTVAGAPLALRKDRFGEHVTLIKPRNETVTYLSNLPPIGYKSFPLLTLDWPLGVDTNTLNGRLRVGGNIIFNGLGMHANSRVAYALDGAYRSFRAEIALDDQAKRQGSVVYRVLVERNDASGQRAWEIAFTSPIVRGGDAPLPVALNVAGATRLALVVEMADRADTRDYANWLNARLLAK